MFSDPADAAAAPSSLPVTLAAVLTFTLLLAIRPESARYTLQFTGCARPSTGTCAFSVGLVTGGSVLTQATLLTVCSIKPSRAFFCAVGSGPARRAHTLPTGRVADAIVTAATGLVTSFSIEMGWARHVAERTDPARRTRTNPADMVTAPAVKTQTLFLTVQPVETLRTRLFAKGSSPSHLAGTSSAHMVAQGLVVTLTPMATTETKHTCWALLMAVCSGVTSLTVALSRHGVTAAISVSTVAAFCTVCSPVPCITGFPAVVSTPARSAGTPPTHGVAASVVLTHTLHLASLTETSTWARVLAGSAHESWRTVT